MKIKIIIVLMLFVNTACQSQTNKQIAFKDVIELFPKQKDTAKYKDDKIDDVINDISKEIAIKYLHFTDEDLKMNDYLYNEDENTQYDNWIEVLPGALGKILREKYVALVYALLKSPSVGLETYKTTLTTFTYEGQVIDSIVIRSEYTMEDDWRDVVFLENDILRIFDYKPNFENFNDKNEIIDDKAPITVVEITDYRIKNDGKIVFAKKYPLQYLKEWVAFYREYRPDSDDPMNSYDFK